jgi:glycosyltransferase involved in cell wall biosynthesis
VPEPIRVSHVMLMSERAGIYPISGLENHLLTLLPALAREAVDVEFIVLTYGIGPELDARLAALRMQGVAVTLVTLAYRRNWRWLGLRRLEQAARLRSLLASRRDRLIHLHVDLVLAGLVLPGRQGAGALFTVHNDDPWLLRPFWRLWLRWLNRQLAHTIAISEQVRRHWLAASGVAPARVTTIHYGLEPPVEQADPAALRARYHIPAGRFVVGFVGRLAPQKNLPLLLKALKRLPRAHAVIVGAGENRAALEQQARDLALDNVQFLGRVPGAAELMPAFDLLCLPSRHEGLGLVLVEAMLREVPVAGSQAGAIPEILGQGQYGLLFDPEDAGALAATLDAAACNASGIAEMARRALVYARETFSLEAMTQRTLAVYRSLLPG